MAIKSTTESTNPTSLIKETHHWVWRDPNRPLWLLISLKSDGYTRQQQRDGVDQYKWCRSATARSLLCCTSEMDARRRMDMVRVLWQHQLDAAHDDLARTMAFWRNQIHVAHARTKEEVDSYWGKEVDRIRDKIKDLERCLTMRLQLCKISTRVVTTTLIEEIP